MAPARPRTVWRCQQCGASAPRWMGRCNECGEYGSYVEEADVSRDATPVECLAAPIALDAVGSGDERRSPTGVDELDHVLGGGLVSGSLVLLGGEPGIGKSTLLLQIAQAMGERGASVLYVCGEESPQQIGLRARRLGADSGSVRLLPELDVTAVEAFVERERPDLLMLDSIQTAFDPGVTGVPGSVGQVRACTARLTRVAKTLGVTTMIVGHVTKDGAIAGPRVLEHMVDTVLYFEGDKDHAFRIVRAVKNRFGSAAEVGVFRMTAYGLRGVGSPSQELLAERDPAAPGSSVMVAAEGSRPLLLEVQALVTPTQSPSPRRLATGIDQARLLQVVAVLERHAGLSLSARDVLVSVAGGLRVTEPAADLPLALALVSAATGAAVPADIASFGEIGLTGHVRAVPHAEARVREAVRFGLPLVVGPESGRADAANLSPVANIRQAVELLGGR